MSQVASKQSPVITSKRRLLVLLSLLVLASIVAWKVKGAQLRQWWLERQSTSTLQSASQRADADPLIRYLYGKRMLLSGQLDAARDALDAAAAQLPGSDHSTLAEQILATDGYIHARDGDLAKAGPLLTRARDLNSDDPLPFLGFGILLSVQRMNKYAITQYQVVTQLDPQNVEAWFRLGSAYIEDLKAAQAIDPLKHAVKLAPNDPASHAELGTAYAIQSQFPLAVPEFQQATRLAPDNQDYRAALANASAMSARTPAEYQTAAVLLGQLVRSRPNDETLMFTLGLLHLRFNALEAARTQFQHCVVIRPTDAEAWYNLSVVELRLGNNAASEAARKRFQKVSDMRTETAILEKKVGARPSDPDLRLALSQSYERAGNLLGAYWQANTAARIAPNSSKAAARMETLKRLLAPEQVKLGSSMLSATGGQVPGPPPPPELVPLNGAVSAGNHP
jgi:Flp pilus assembly protein TadD